MKTALVNRRKRRLALEKAGSLGRSEKMRGFIVSKFAIEKGLTEESLRAYRMVAKILTALRNNYSIEDNAIFMSQLPHELQVIYARNWGIRHQLGTIEYTDQFIQEVIYEDNRSNYLDFMSELEVLEAIVLLFSILKQYTPTRQFDIISKMLPRDLLPVIASGNISGSINDCI